MSYCGITVETKMGEGKMSALMSVGHSNGTVGDGAYTAMANDHSVR